MSTVVEYVPKSPGPAPSGDRSTGAFLIRVWYEAREIDGGAPEFRGYIKNLHTGEERFVRDPANVSEQILRQMRDESLTAAGEESKRHEH